MKLPYADRAYIPRSKLIAYLLSEVHPVGKDKAKVLRKYGFNEGNIDLSPISSWNDCMEDRR